MSIIYLNEHSLGIAVVTNQESGEAFNSLTWHIVDHYLGVPATDWVDAYLKDRARRDARTTEALKKAADARRLISALISTTFCLSRARNHRSAEPGRWPSER